MFKAIIIGCGKIAGICDGQMDGPILSHARAYRETSGVTVVDYIDIVPERAKSLAKLYGCSGSGTDYTASMARHKPDIVSLCTPDDTHFPIAWQILSGTTVPRILFIEKPVCTRIEQLSILKALALERNIIIVVNHSRRFDDRYRTIRKAILAGRFGRLVRCDAFYYGGWMHNGVHIVDTLLFLFDDNLTVGKVYGSVPSRHADDPTLEMHLTFKRSGADVYIHAFDEKYYQLFDIDLKFEEARLRIEDFGSRFILERKATNALHENVLLPDNLELHDSNAPLMIAIGSMVNCLSTGDSRPLECFTIETAGATMNVLWEGVTAYETGFGE